MASQLAAAPGASSAMSSRRRWPQSLRCAGGTAAASGPIEVPAINAGFSLAAGEAESKGLEVDLSGSLPGDLRYTFSYAYTDAEISKAVADFNFGLPLPAGTPLINIPKNSANLLVMKAFDVGTGRFTVGGGVNYVSERIGETGTPSFVLNGLPLSGTYSWATLKPQVEARLR